MRTIGLTVLVVVLGTSAQVQTPAALLKDAQAELADAAKELAESKPYQRWQRAKRLMEGLQAMVAAEKKPETESK